MSLSENTSLLIQAVATGDIAKVTTRLKSLATEVNEVDRLGRTALMRAVAGGYSDIVKLLLQHNADPNIADYSGRTALTRAITTGNIKIVEMLLKHKTDFSRTTDDQTPLMLAIASGNVEVIKLLLRNGADPNQTIKSKAGSVTPLKYAEQLKNPSVSPEIMGLLKSPSSSTARMFNELNVNVHDVGLQQGVQKKADVKPNVPIANNAAPIAPKDQNDSVGLNEKSDVLKKVQRFGVRTPF